MLSQFLKSTVDIVWGTPLLILLIGGGILLFCYSKFLPLRGFIHAFKLITGRIHHPSDKIAKGQLSHFQALTNALSATVGMGNIAGVAVAITQGGPGAIFWMWVAAFIGMNTKFFECTLSLMYRQKDSDGEIQGGPMYVIQNALPKQFKFLAIIFAVFGLIGTLALFQVNQLTMFLKDQYSVEPLYVGIVSAIFVAVIVGGGVKRIGKVTSFLVPSMCAIYIVACLIILFNHWSSLPMIFSSIFVNAFSGKAVFGGAVGVAVMEAMKIGIKRAAFSNEAGIGTAPMAHGNAKTNEPVSEGLVAMLGPFLDTIVVCTMTALVILVSLPPGASEQSSGVVLTMQAFQINFPDYGHHILGLAVLLFSTTTMIGMANYNQKCWNFLFRGRFFLGQKAFLLWFCTCLVFGALSAWEDVVNLLDIGYALMAYPNMLATIYLAPKVKKATLKYFKKYREEII